MRPRTLVLLGVAIVCGLVAAFMVSQMSAGPSKVESVTVLVAKRDLGPGATINFEQDIAEQARPKNLYNPKTMYTKPEEVKGKILARSVSEGSPVEKKDILTGATILNDLKQGNRALTVRATIYNTVHGFVQPGFHVDLICTTNPIDDPGITESKIFMQNVKVLAINRQSTMAEKQKSAGAPVSVTMEVKPEQAQRLYWVASRRVVGIMLRKPEDKEIDDLPAATSPYASDDVSEGGKGTVDVPLAIVDIEPGTPITSFDEYFRTVKLPKGMFGNVITDKKQLEGEVVTRYLAANQPPTGQNFAVIGVKVAKKDTSTFVTTIINGARTESTTHDVVEKTPREVLPPPKKGEGSEGE